MNATTRAFHALIRCHQRAGMCHACSMLLAFTRIEAAQGSKFEALQRFHPACERVALGRFGKVEVANVA